MIRVLLPLHLSRLAGSERELALEVTGGTVTQRTLLDALEARHPVLVDTIRDRRSQRRRALVRFYACGEDLSNDDPDTPLPDAVVAGTEPYVILGAMAGG